MQPSLCLEVQPLEKKTLHGRFRGQRNQLWVCADRLAGSDWPVTFSKTTFDLVSDGISVGFRCLWRQRLGDLRGECGRPQVFGIKHAERSTGMTDVSGQLHSRQLRKSA